MEIETASTGSRHVACLGTTHYGTLGAHPVHALAHSVHSLAHYLSKGLCRTRVKCVRLSPSVIVIDLGPAAAKKKKPRKQTTKKKTTINKKTPSHVQSQLNS